MNNLKIFEYSQDINIDSIFERKIELGAVIQFSLLQRVLEEFIKRQKSMNDKISLLESKIKIISKHKSGEDKELELLLIKTEDEFKNKIEEYENKNKEIKIHNKEENKETKNIIENENKIDEEEKKMKEKKNKENDEKNNEENKGINEENKGNGKKDNEKKEDNKIEEIFVDNSDSDIKNRINKLESMMKEMVNFVKKINNNLNEYKNQTTKANKFHENKINELFKKVAYLSDFEMLKIDNRPNDEKTDISKDMVNSIEYNLSKRIGNIENRLKLNDDSIYSLKKDLVTLKNINDNLSKLIHTNQDNIASLSKDLETKTNLLNKKIEDEIKKIKDNCDKNYQENRYEIIKYNNELNDKFNNLINDINKNKNSKNLNSMAIGNEKLNDLNNELKNYINKSITDTERYLKSIIANLKIEVIKNDLSEIHEEINQNKLLKKDIELINTKISEIIEKKILELSQRMDAISTDINLCNDTCNKTVKMVEYLSGQMIQTYQPDLDNNKVNTINYHDLKQDIDMTSYMTKDLFKEEKNKLLKKIEKTLEIEGENYLFIQRLEERLKFLASENDLRNMEQSFISLLEELKIYFTKKYLDKNEAQKSLKLIELQLKQIIETGTFNNRDSDNWLLAKKPLNDHVCASCESYLGELKNKSVFLPWNRIPSREEKKYRMGQGFSKMLQLMNMDILKNADKINPDLSIKYNDEKKTEEYRKLPKINSQINIHNQNKTYSMYPSSNSVDHIDYGLNNSVDNVEQNDEKKINDVKNLSSSVNNKSCEKDKNLDVIKSNNNIQMKTNYKNFYSSRVVASQPSSDNEPKVMRIVKINKK